jgi:hypothetical protein
MAFLHGVEIVELDGGPRPISSVASSVIGLIGTAKKGPVNTPVLIAGSRAEAIAQFGVPDGASTIPDALDAIFDQAGAMVVVINVQAKTDVSGESITMNTSGVADVANYYVSSPALTDGTDTSITYVQGTDYVITSKTADNGGDQVVVVEGSALATAVSALADGATLSLSISYQHVPTMTATATDVISADNADGGIQALLGAESKVHVTPRLLIAPGFTGPSADNTTVTEAQAITVVGDLVSVADRLRAIVVADGPDSDDSSAISYRGKLPDSGRLYLVDPKVMVVDSSGAEVQQPSSARVAGIIAKSDNERGFWCSPSNRPMLGISGTSRGIDFALGDKLARANLLNENHVATVIHQNGYRLWGNRSCSSDAKWAFISVRRTADLINDALLRAHLWAVDRNITKTYIEDVTEGVNNYLRHLKSIGAIINGKCWADPELNTPDQIVQGKIYFDFDFTPPYPAEHITFRSSLVNDYLEEIFA